MKIVETNLKWNGSLSYNNKPVAIILHNADAITCSIEDIHRWHINNGWSGCGYHYLVRKDGTIHRGRPENAQGAHCTSWNAKSIGICAEGAFMKETMPEAQLKAIQELIADIDRRYNKMPVHGHKEKNSTNCPGINYPLDKLKARENNTPAPSPSPTPTPSTQWALNLQKELNKQGYRDKNGNKLAEDGIAGQLTLSACPTLKKGAQGNITRLLQEKLNQFGYTTNGIDGIFGNGTHNAVVSYQRNKGLGADGIVGKATWGKILNA